MLMETGTHSNTVAIWVGRLLTAWLTAVALEFLLLPEEAMTLEGFTALKEMSMLRTCIFFVAALGGMWGLSTLKRFEKLRRWLPAIMFWGPVCVLSMAVRTVPFMILCGIVCIILVVYGFCGWNGSEPALRPAEKEDRRYMWIAVGVTAAFFLLVSVWMVCRTQSFCSPTYDFGIFAQMFHSMKAHGVPITTVERDGPLSHFLVHMSPIYYLMLPFYCIVPRPETLQVLQAALLALAVIPLWNLGKLHGMNGRMRLLVCILMLLQPAFGGGASYDLHENAFLTVLLLWLLYAVDKNSLWQMAASVLLTLMVKEDAAVYVAVVGLYLLAKSMVYRDAGGILWGIWILGVSLLWFSIVTWYLSTRGDGVMTYRYGNFMYDGSNSLLTVIRAVFLCPMKALFECADSEKLEYLALTLLPLLGLPLMTRRYERYILLIPYILVNLMPDYTYQHSVFFQYNFGSQAFLIYLTLVNLADIRLEKRRIMALVSAAVVSIACFAGTVLPEASGYIQTRTVYSGYYANVRKALSVIPEDASVSCTTFYSTHLSQRDVLYDVRYSSLEHILSTEYVALNMTASGDFERFASNGTDGYQRFVSILEENGYELLNQWEDRVAVYHKK